MGVSSISSGSFGLVAAGVRGQLRAMVHRSVLSEAGVLDRHLATGYDVLERTGRDLARAGAAALKHEAVGALIDVMG